MVAMQSSLTSHIILVLESLSSRDLFYSEKLTSWFFNYFQVYGISWLVIFVILFVMKVSFNLHPNPHTPVLGIK